MLAAVNVHNLYKDSKTFVDMPMKRDPEETLMEFERRFGKLELQNIDRVELQAFIEEYFAPPGAELEECELKEWMEFPPRLMRIQDPALREWALKLNSIWKLLCRKVRILKIWIK
ncbi:unnamed protein product [Gongylonema pulchrum]|uniref:Trehalase n=1 Tax=Gongylonema pulchrum TaxID=637853 RepID=A0A3P7RIP2_9BILA|nr:unnamed protein product [Gongylonema pulchrum]